MTVEEAFRRGLELVREAGLPAKGTDRAVIAAETVFRKRATPVQADPRFPADGPIFAKKVILEAYAAG